MKRSAFGLLASLCLLVSPSQASPPKLSQAVLSPVYTIDRKYKSMEGPQTTQHVYLANPSVPELVWVTGIKTEMVGEDGVTPTLPEFMCHVNVDLNVARHRSLFQWSKMVSSRLLTLSQGQVEASFPEGFGLPLLSNEPISLTTQVLNHNLERPNLKVRHKVTFEYIRDRDLREPLKPLFNTSAFGMALLPKPSGAAATLQGVGVGTKNDQTCLPGEHAPNAAAGSTYYDGSGHQYTGHWVVKPGREVNRTNVTRQLNLPFDTTLHHAAVHLHPFAESLELRDLTTGKTVFKSAARGPEKGVGLTHVDSYSSAEGVPLYRNHQYELVSVYNNTTQENQDSMAVMLLFLADKEFKKPSVGSPVSAADAAAAKVTADTRVVLRTLAGDLVLKLYPEAAPKTAAQIARLARAGAYDTTHFYRVEPGFVAQTSLVSDRTVPLTPQQQALVRPVPLEVGSLKHRRGVLSLARLEQDPNSGSTSFCIMLGEAPHLDGKYTIFGEVESGLEVLSAIEAVERKNGARPAVRLQILSAEVVDSKEALSKLKLEGPKPVIGGVSAVPNSAHH